MINLILIRHGKSLRNKIGIWGRTLDAALDNEFLFQMTNTKEQLSTLTKFQVFSSPLIRCIQTAQYIFDSKKDIEIIDEICAYHSGFFENKTDDFIKNNYPHYLSQTFKERFLQPKFDEESIFDQTARIKKGFKKIVNTATLPTIAVSTHYSVINVIANIVASNFTIPSYADGMFDILEGGYIEVSLEKNTLLNNLDK